ncbi:uncharacterized protein IWZ02DRAFT_248582 [Phyllosticta citriasiana]|uniref:uncharacterized protein n=1 Tax=Phyllosticta citriasiana TaxID=595635 RepID=UPI0030FD8E52
MVMIDGFGVGQWFSQACRVGVGACGCGGRLLPDSTSMWGREDDDDNNSNNNNISSSVQYRSPRLFLNHHHDDWTKTTRTPAHFAVSRISSRLLQDFPFCLAPQPTLTPRHRHRRRSLGTCEKHNSLAFIPLFPPLDADRKRKKNQKKKKKTPPTESTTYNTSPQSYLQDRIYIDAQHTPPTATLSPPPLAPPAPQEDQGHHEPQTTTVGKRASFSTCTRSSRRPTRAPRSTAATASLPKTFSTA